MSRHAPRPAASPPHSTPWSAVEAELLRHAGDFAGAVSIQDLSERALRLIEALVPMARASLSLLDPLTGHLKLVAAIGNPDARVGQVVTRPRSVSEWVLREGRGLVLQGRVLSPRMEGIGDSRIQSSLCLPIRGGRGPIGVLSLGRGAASPAFEDHELALASAGLIPLSTAISHRLEMDRATRALADLHQAACEPRAPWRTRLSSARGFECAADVRRSWEHGGAFAASRTRADGTSWMAVADVGASGLRALERSRVLEGAFLAAAESCADLADLALRLDGIWGSQFESDEPCVAWLARPGAAGLVETCTLGIASLHLLTSESQPTQVTGLAQPGLGVRREIGPHVQQHRLLPGDTLVFANAGLLECADAGGEPFGLERFRDALATHRTRPLAVLVGSTCAAALEHAGRSWWRSDLLVAGIRSRREER